MNGKYAVAQPVSFAGGLAVFEAEASTNLIPRAGRWWEFGNQPAGASGTGFMVVTNGTDANSNINVNVATASPEMRYDLGLPVAGPFYVWMSAYAQDGTEDSVHFGFDGAVDSANPVNFPVYNTWVWSEAARTVTVASAGIHPFSIWMREDGTKIDRIAVTTNAAFRPRIGNAWHIPHNAEPGVGFMRTPIHEIYPDTEVVLSTGGQYQGGTNAGNQLLTGSTLYYKASTSVTWSAVALAFHSASGNNKYYTGAIPAGTFAAGVEVQYYFRIPFDNFLPTFLAISNGVRMETEFEAQAQANAFSYLVREPPAAGYPSPADWRNENIYFLMTDRFYDGDPSNNSADPWSVYDPANGARLHGGDFAGILKKLDYLQALGVTAIWITPIPRNTEQRAYHGYSAYDLYGLAPQLGSTNDLQTMTGAAHARGIRVVLDIVANHQGRIIDSGDAGYPAYNAAGNYNLRWTNPSIQYPPPFDQVSDFHAHGDIGTYVDPDQILGDLRGLDDLKTETVHVRSNLVQVYKHWILTGDLDGFRIDTVKHVELGFWQFFGGEIRSFANRMGKTNFFSFGEVFDSSDAKCGAYTGTQGGGPFAMESVLDYPLYDKINSVFAFASGDTDQIEDRYDALAANYDASARDRLVTFLDNHDNVRFLSGGRANNNLTRLNLGLVFLYTSRGIPCLYYGTEQHFNGGDDPDNREDMFDGQFEQGPSLGDNFNMTKAGFLLVARLNNFRRNYPALASGEHVNRWSNGSGPGLLAYSRRTSTQEVLVAMNTGASSQVLTNRPTSYAPGTVMVNVFNTNESITVTSATSTPPFTVAAGSYKIFVARNEWKPLNPAVTNQSPAHGATGVSPFGPVVLHFSAPMATSITASAFRLDPPASGSFTWAANGTQLTFTPSASNPLNGLTRYVVRIETNAADSATGAAFHAPYESFFETAALPDTDGDGVPDWWMQNYFGHATGRVDDLSMADQNADADALSNRDEYIAGTDPTDPLSFFHLSGIGEQGVAVWSVAGRRYDLEANAVTDQAWNVVISNQPGADALLVVPVSGVSSTSWFRARVWRP